METRNIDCAGAGPERLREISRRHWLVTNGLGGYASGTVGGVPAWRYHGLLVAALPPPLGRTVLLNHLETHLQSGAGDWLEMGDARPHDSALPDHAMRLVSFRLEDLLPTWTYQLGDAVIEKAVFLLHDQNTVHITYRLTGNLHAARLRVRPFVQFRGHEHPVSGPRPTGYEVAVCDNRYEISHRDFPPLRMAVNEERASFANDGDPYQEMLYEKESERGFEARGTLYTPGYFQFELRHRRYATLIASCESWDRLGALTTTEALALHHERCGRLLSVAPAECRTRPVADLVLAADQFITTPRERVADSARAQAAGDEVRTVIAGYPWFTDWGRDTMISLEGLTLITGRHAEARWILRTFARHIRDGLIPNMFPEGNHQGLYHTADATLWFFHALDRYRHYTGDTETVRNFLPALLDIIEKHRAGTRFGIHVDHGDGLLCQGEEGYQLTWMDAKVGDWVVTPRRGKAVEINALWYNALRLAAGWAGEAGNSGKADDLSATAEQVLASFNRRFWFAPGSHLFDVVDGPAGDDPALRPNQLIAISLKHPVLEQRRWEPVVAVVQEKLLTPVGLRSLTPDHRDYKAKYFGDLRARDAAYHQGTVWAWLIGPFIDAWLKVHPADTKAARDFLSGFTPHLDEACVGSISEIFDGDAPFAPRGCVAQAWSVAEVLRSHVKVGRAGNESKTAE